MKVLFLFQQTLCPSPPACAPSVFQTVTAVNFLFSSREIFRSRIRTLLNNCGFLNNTSRLTGEDCERNGMGIALSLGLKEGALQVNRESDRLIWMKLAVGNVTVNMVSAYAPQVGTTDIEKDDF